MLMSYCDLIPQILYPISTVKMTCNDDIVYCYLFNAHSIGKNSQQTKQSPPSRLSMFMCIGIWNSSDEAIPCSSVLMGHRFQTPISYETASITRREKYRKRN